MVKLKVAYSRYHGWTEITKVRVCCESSTALWSTTLWLRQVNNFLIELSYNYVFIATCMTGDNEYCLRSVTYNCWYITAVTRVVRVQWTYIPKPRQTNLQNMTIKVIISFLFVNIECLFLLLMFAFLCVCRKMRSHPDCIVLYLHIMQINETCVTLKHKKRTLTYVDNQNIPNTTGHIWTARNMINNVRNYVEHPVFRGVRFTRSLLLCTCFVDRCLFFCHSSFGHCVVCSASIYVLWLPLWYLQTLLTKRSTTTEVYYNAHAHKLNNNTIHTAAYTPGFICFLTFPDKHGNT
jgi:hypothetical protein